MVELAVILAAGMGTRLKHRTESMPKGFLQIGGKSLIERSLQLLSECGIEKVLIGTGYEQEWFNKLSLKGLQIASVPNERYAESGSLETLIRMRKMIHEDFLLLESDLIYEKKALKTVLQSTAQDLILASGPTQSGDEVWIETGVNSRLVSMNKDKSKLSKPDAELVGISKISSGLYRDICAWADQLPSPTPFHYEDALTVMSKSRMIRVQRVDGLLWAEIDDEQHLNRVNEKIWPQIRELENEINA